MRITTTSIFINDQDKALTFYTSKLGFLIKDDLPLGEFRWITLVAPGEENDTELLLEPNNHPAAKVYQKSIYADGIPAAMFGVEDLQADYEKLVDQGVKFTMTPRVMDGFKMAVFDDTCGNLIQIVEQ